MHIRIHHLSGSKKGTATVYQTSPITVGRHESNTLAFDRKFDRTVSARHAELILEGKEWIFCDQNSTAGSWLNGKQINRYRLFGGEEIELGPGGPRLRFEIIDNSQERSTSVVPAPTEPSTHPSTQPIGAKTVGMMIQDAVYKARNAKTGRVERISFIRSVASDAVKHGSRRFKIVVSLIIVALIGIMAVLTWELQRTRMELKSLNLAKMGPSELGEWITEHNRHAIYLFTYRSRTGFEQGFCTGFAINTKQLLTNAHCVAQMKQLSQEGATLYAVGNEGLAARYSIKGWLADRRYNANAPTPTADIGLVTVAQSLPKAVAIADAKYIAALKAGAQVFVYGFPGDLSNVNSPVATITNGVIGRMTALDGSAANTENQVLLQYSAFTTKGTSGSPVFDKHGRVVAINSGYYQGKSRLKLEDPTTGKSEEANVFRDLSGYAFGIRIDLAREVLNGSSYR